MVIQHADVNGKQIEPLLDAELDAELNENRKDFEMVLDIEEYGKRFKAGERIFIEDTEVGGLIHDILIDTATNTMKVGGYTWRGMLDHKIIVPPVGYNHYVVSGELNQIIRDFVENEFPNLFRVPNVSTGINVSSFKFDRFCTLSEGLNKLLLNNGHRLKIKYNVGSPNRSGWVDIYAEPIRDLSKQIELSQDSKMNFTMHKVTNGVNHLVVAGKGDMQAREVFHLYVQRNGLIGDVQYYTGVDEVTALYVDTSTDSEDLRNRAVERLKSLMSKSTMSMNVEELGIDAEIGDIIGCRDYITGIYMKKPIGNIIVKVKNGELIKEYKVEGE